MNTNEQIAMELGYEKSEIRWTECRDLQLWRRPSPNEHALPVELPDFEHDWAHAGPLLGEMVGELEFTGLLRIWDMYRKHAGDTLTEAISHAWLAWKKEDRDG